MEPVDALRWVPVSEASVDQQLAFDHATLIAQSIASTRPEVQNLALPPGSLPDEFTRGKVHAKSGLKLIGCDASFDAVIATAIKDVAFHGLRSG